MENHPEDIEPEPEPKVRRNLQSFSYCITISSNSLFISVFDDHGQKRS